MSKQSRPTPLHLDVHPGWRVHTSSEYWFLVVERDSGAEKQDMLPAMGVYLPTLEWHTCLKGVARHVGELQFRLMMAEGPEALREWYAKRRGG